MPYSESIAGLDHVELQATDDTDDRVPCPGDRHEDLHQAFFRELSDRLVESLVTDVRRPQDRKLLRGEPRYARKLHEPTRAQRVANRDATRVHDAHHVARKGLRNSLPIASKESVHAREPQLSTKTRVGHEHVLRQPARTDAHKRNPISVTRVHVRLDLEHEPREVGIARMDQASAARPWTRWRSQRQQRVQKRLHAEVVQRAAEEDWCLPGLSVRIGIKPGAGARDDLDRLDRQQGAVRVLAEVLVAGRVEQRDVVPLQLELERRRADGNTALLLHLHPVRHRVALRPAPAHGPGEVDRAGIEEQLLR
jgi:hypothetical protein